ncbi:helix-turn-helix domain-containing protein [Oceanobacillus sp. CF4.6]|uniref:helix-turn-helix domain-containing protein n=1 Tax=Oceanobacillus sp. CF4.6 TaxID=3373080 RepID=UPI003EE68DEF
MEFGAVLRRMRKGAGKSQLELSEELHIARSNVSKLESDKMKLTLEDAIKWAKQTDSQDMLVALIINVDVATVADMLTQLTDVATIFLGGIL